MKVLLSAGLLSLYIRMQTRNAQRPHGECSVSTRRLSIMSKGWVVTELANRNERDQP
jgi:hypothetical protein